MYDDRCISGHTHRSGRTRFDTVPRACAAIDKKALAPGSGAELRNAQEIGHQIPGLVFVEVLPGRHGCSLYTFLDHVEDPSWRGSTLPGRIGKAWGSAREISANTMAIGAGTVAQRAVFQIKSAALLASRQRGQPVCRDFEVAVPRWQFLSRTSQEYRQQNGQGRPSPDRIPSRARAHSQGVGPPRQFYPARRAS